MPRVNTPYVREAYDSPGYARMSDLIRRRGDIEAAAAQQKGDSRVALALTLGQLAQGITGAIGQYYEQAPMRAAEQEKAKAAAEARSRQIAIEDVQRKVPLSDATGRPDNQRIAENVQMIDPAAARAFWQAANEDEKAETARRSALFQDVAGRLASFELATRKMDPTERQTLWQTERDGVLAAFPGVISPDDIPERYNPAFVTRTIQQMLPIGEQWKALQEAVGEPFTLSPGQKRFDAGGEEIAGVAEPVKEPEPFTLSPGSVRYGPDGKKIASVPAAPREPPMPSFQTKEVLNDAGKPVIANYDARTGRLVDPESEQVIKNPKPVPSAAETQDARKFQQAGPILAAVSELSEKINTQQGLIAKMSGGVEKVKAQANYNDDLAEYQALIMGFTPLVARALGHTGVLTQQDVDSVRELFPKPGDSKTLRDRKIARINGIIGQLQTGAGGPPPGSGPVSVRTPDGQTFTFPTQAAADAFKARARIP